MFEHEPVGRYLKLAVAGASHAPALRFRLENFPASFRVDRAALADFMARRAPGRDDLSTARREDDAVAFSEGLDADGRTTGAALVGTIANRDTRPGDYGAADSAAAVPRPGHADFGQWIEQGRIPTGGGANSGRLTACVCAAGGICLQYLASRGISVAAAPVEIGGRTEDFEATVRAARADGDSVGGRIRCTVTGLPAGLGGALFAGLESQLAAAMMSVPGAKGVAFGNGFAACALRGSENDDAFAVGEDGRIVTATNRHGGILGGRTTGMPVDFEVGLKPTPTVFRPLASADLETRRPATCISRGRHDPCIVLRAVPVIEALTALVFADALLATEAARPRICLTLTGRTLAEDIAEYASERYFTDLVELRVDLLDESERAHAAEFPARLAAAGAAVPVLLTFRRKADGGAYDGPEDVRRRFFLSTLAAGASAFAYVDLEEDFRDAAVEAAVRRAGARIVRSRHDFTGTRPFSVDDCRALVAGTDEIAKIAFLPRSADDVAWLFRETADFTDVPHVVCAMGPLGVATRVLAARTHSAWTYASVAGRGAPGQLAPRELVRTYRFRTATADWTACGVTGWPLAFTRSPELHNAAHGAADADAVMAPFPCETAAQAVSMIHLAGLRGMAVTYPHKQAILPLLDEIDPVARAIGAVNTVVRDGETLRGFNTDAAGFAAALKAFLGRDDLRGLKASVIGAGGAARAVVWALRAPGVAFCVFNRTEAKAAALAAEFGGASAPLGPEGEARLAEYADLVVQCAAPDGDPAHFDPLAFHRFTGREAVYDLVYEPAVTPTLARARAAGCRVENGLSMLVAQAAAQREIWK